MSVVTLTVTNDEWASAKDGTLRIVREGSTRTLSGNLGVLRFEPFGFVQACAPCETCEGMRVDLSKFYHGPDRPCPDCRIELVGPCPECEGHQGRSFKWDDDLDIRHEDWVDCTRCAATGAVTFGYAYAVRKPVVRKIPDSHGDGRVWMVMLPSAGSWWHHVYRRSFREAIGVAIKWADGHDER